MQVREVKATFSIVAAGAATGEVGVAVQSKYFSVGSVVPWAEAGLGAVATQAAGVAAYGPGDDAIAVLRTCAAEASLREQAHRDEDFASIRDWADFSAVVG